MKSIVRFLIYSQLLTICFGVSSALAVDKVLSLDGNGDFMEVNEPFTNNTVFTISLWVNPYVINDGGYHGFIGKQGDQYRKPGLWLAPSNGGLHYDSYSSDGIRYDDLLDGFFTSARQWVHVAWVKDDTEYRIYRNGLLFATRTAPTSFYTADSSYWIGRVDNYWNGLIDEVRIWNIARTQEEIRATMNTTLKGNEPGLVGYWNFDDGTANDSSPYRNHGTLEGNAKIVEIFPSGIPILSFDIEPKDKIEFNLIINVNPNGNEFNTLQLSFNYSNNVSLLDMQNIKNNILTGNYDLMTPFPPETNKLKFLVGYINNKFTGDKVYEIARVKMRRTDNGINSITFNWLNNGEIETALSMLNESFTTENGRLKTEDRTFPAISTTGCSDTEPQRTGVVYLTLIAGDTPKPNACGLNPKNPPSEWTGWDGPLDKDNVSIGEGVGSRNPITIGGVRYKHGIGTHSQAKLVYDLTGADYIKFGAVVGLDDETDGPVVDGKYTAPECGHGGSAQFIFSIDGRRVADSGVLKGVTNQRNTEGKNISFDIPKGSKELVIEIKDGGDGNFCDHADMGDAKLLTTPAPPARLLSITSVAASPGDKVTISISITDATGLTAGDILVRYDANVLTVGEVKGTDLISSLNLIVNKDVPGQIKLPMAGTKGIPSGSGAMVEIELTVSKDAKVGTETTLSFSDTEIYDESGAVIPVSLENGVVKITQPGIKGDVNNDGKVRSNDAMLALRIAAGLMEPSDYQKWAADMNDDGKIRSNDAMLILRKAAGLAAPEIQPVATGSGEITVMLGEAHGVAGERITVPLTVDDVHQLASGDICISYDNSVLRAVEVSSDSEVLLQSNLAETGMIRIAFASTDGLNSKTVAKIRFDILADDVSPLTIKQVELYQEDALLVDSQKIDGMFSSWAIPPENSALLQNFPNPFNPETWIPYQLAEEGDVTIRIYNVKGQLIKTLELGYQPAGIYTHRSRAAYWDGKNEEGVRAASGVYFYQLRAGQFAAMRKLILLK
ncbi:T9SS type A sorting domain-containing protein [Candidatus Poribacteria bacterium]|nr:T9SS type A sorting domain-containing protein [Candidatus Poribacteria bacterium]